MRKAILLLLVVMMLVPALPAVNAQDDVLQLIIGTTDDIAKLDPADSYSFHDWELLRNTNDGLLGFVPGETVLEPRLAVDFPEVSEDGMTYTYTMRDDAMFPDGTLLTPELYVSSIKRAMTLQGDAYGLISMIADVVSDGQNIIFTLNEPFDLFPMITALPITFPAHPDLFPADEMNNQPAQLVGVGPYQVVEWVADESTVLERNPNYYGDNKGAYDRIVFVYYEEAASLDNAIESGEVDIAWRANTISEIPRLSEVEELEVITLPGRIQYLVINHELVTDANVKKGIAAAINRDELVDRAMAGEAEPLYSMVPPAFLGANEAFLDTYGFGDADEARAFFEAAGYTEDAKLEIDLWYPPERYGATVGPVMEIIEQQLEATGVVEVTLQNVEWATYVEAATGGEYPIFFLGWFFDYPDSDNYLHPFASCAGSPGMGVNYCNDTMEELILAERGLVSDPDARTEALAELQNFYAEEVVTIPLFYAADHLIYNTSKVTNVLVGGDLALTYTVLEPVQ